MRHHRPLRTIVPVLGIVSFALCGGLCPGAASAQDDAVALPPPAGRKVDFAREIRPILEAKCYACHGPKKQKSDLRLDRKSAALKGGAEGPAIVPGNSASSAL